MGFKLRLVATSLAVLLLVACGTSGTSSSSGPKAISGGSINVRLTGDWPDFDPQGILSLNGNGVVSAVYDRLITLDKNGQAVPYLAKSWKASASQIVFTLRTDATCSDGTKLTPTNVANSFQRLINKKQVAPQLWGPGPYTVSADDAAGTFTLSLGTPWSDALYSFAILNTSVMCPAALTGNPLTTPVGSGPYTLVSAVHGDSQVLKKRSDWNWGPQGMNSSTPGLPDQITFKVIANDTTAANLLTTGGLDFGQITGPDVTRLAADKSLIHQSGNGTYVYPVVFNEEAGHPTADDKVRQALTTAVDPKAYIQAAFAGFSHPSPSFLAPSIRCYDGSVAKYLPKPSVSQAKSILLSDGYTADSSGKLSKDGKPLTIKLVSTSANYGQGPEYLAAQWEQVGINVNYTDIDYAAYALALRAGNFDAGTENVASANGATGSFIGYESGPTPAQGGTNYAHNIDPTMVALIGQAESTTGADSCKYWSQVQARMLTQHHMLPLGTAETQYFGRGVEMSPQTYLNGNMISIWLRRVSS